MVSGTCIASIVLGLPAFLICVRAWRVRGWGRFRPPQGLSLRGRVAVVTGAASGLGLATAQALASLGATVVLACRDEERALEAKRLVLARHPHVDEKNLLPHAVDLASLASVRAFAERLLPAAPRLHLLVCNAGVYFPGGACPRTADGFEAHLGVNHLSHFLLVRMLLPRLQDSAPSRVVIVASSLFERSVASFSPVCIPPGYSTSKLCNVLFSRELAARAAGTGVSVYAVCPGFCYTGLFRTRGLRWYHYVLMAPVAFFFMRSADQGAQTILHCALSNAVAAESGLIYKDCKHYKPRKMPPAQAASDLWVASERMVESCSLGHPEPAATVS